MNTQKKIIIVLLINTISTWALDGAIDDLKLFFQVGKRLAFTEKWPEWKEGSEFKAIREKQLK